MTSETVQTMMENFDRFDRDDHREDRDVSEGERPHADRDEGGEDPTDRLGRQVPPAEGSIEVGNVAQGSYDVYGARNSEDGTLRHMNNQLPGGPGWLGNPYKMDGETVAERRRVIAAYLRDFCRKMATDEEFREAVEWLRGETVACWCRGVSQDREETNWCHLDVVKCWLDGDLGPVYDYLRGSGHDQ